MKKLLALVLALCLSAAAAGVLAEEDFADYLDTHPEAAVYVSSWVAADGEWRIDVFSEDGGIKLGVVHRLGDNKEDVWEYSADMSEEGTQCPGGRSAGPALSAGYRHD